jgi:hypothetical protein
MHRSNPVFGRPVERSSNPVKYQTGATAELPAVLGKERLVSRQMERTASKGRPANRKQRNARKQTRQNCGVGTCSSPERRPCSGRRKVILACGPFITGKPNDWRRTCWCALLSLALWRLLQMWMLGKGLGSNARKLVNAFGTIEWMDVVVPVRRGGMEVKVRLRTVAKPDQDVAVLLSHLGLRLPSRSKTVQNVVEKNG